MRSAGSRVGVKSVLPLAGYNYVIKKEQNSLEVLVLGVRGTQAVAAAPPKAQESLAKRWRTPVVKPGP